MTAALLLVSVVAVLAGVISGLILAFTHGPAVGFFTCVCGVGLSCLTFPERFIDRGSNDGQE